MDRREFSANGKPRRGDAPRAAAASAPADERLARAQLIVECARAILRAHGEAELAGTVCRLLVHPGIYDEAGIAFIGGHPGEEAGTGAVEGAPQSTFERALYAGPDKKCVKHPEAFWAVPARKAALAALLAGEPGAGAGLPVVALKLDGRVLGVMSVSPGGARIPDAEELEQLHCLADDICCALSMLRESAPQRALAASERRLRETVEHAGVGITRIDMNGRFIEVNQKFCEMLGYAREELVGRSTRDVTVPEDYGPGANFRAQAQLGRATVHSREKRYRRRDGSDVWVRVTISLALDEHGNVRDTIAIVEDITERKAAEETMRNERSLLRTIIDAVPHVIYVKDVAGRFTLVNAAWLEARGLTSDQVHGKTVHDLFPQERAQRMDGQDQAVLGGGALLDVEGSSAPVDGTVRWLSTTKVPLRDAAGNVVGLVGISRDITEGKRIEKELREYVERFEIAARATSDVIWDWDLDAATIWWGEALEKAYGYSREAMGSTVESWTSRIHPADVDNVTDSIRRAVELGARSWSADYRFQRADGAWADVYDRGYIMRDEAGKAIRLLGAMMDISERKTTEAAIGRERALLRTIIDALPDYIHVKDAEGHIQLGNRAWLEARHLGSADVRGKTVFDLFPPGIAQRMEEQDRRIIETGEGFAEQELPIFLLDERGNRLPRWSSTTKVPMRDDAGNIIGVVGISRDITERRRMERERAMEHVVAHVLSESRSVAQTLPRLIRTVCEAMNWAYGAYWVWNPESKSLQRAESWCQFEPAFEPADEEFWREIIEPHAAGLLGRAWLEQRATWVTEIEKMGAGFRRSVSCRKFGFRSAYAFPIFADEEPVGVIEFFGRDTREPDEALLEVSGAISKQIGQFVRRKRAEESLQENEQQLRAMFENADVGIAVTGLDMRYLRVNDKYCSIIGYERQELQRMRASDVNLESNLADMQARRNRMLEEHESSNSSEKQLVRKDGSLVWVSIATSLVRASDGAPRYFIAVIQDISESRRAAEALKESEEQYRVLAHYDILTGLPNRALFYDRLAHALAQARRNRWWLAVMFIDVDRFKNVNDTMGHAAGDLLLKQISARLSECVRGEDTVGRLSGDEFAIVLTRLTAPEDAANVAKKIVGEFNRSFHVEETELFVTSSIGITVFPTDTVDQDTLIRNADVAMYRAKDRGRNNYQFYTPEMNTRTREMLSMEGELRRAIERDEFVLHYQPKVSLATGTVTGVEALLRWRHPERGLVPPGDFIPLLEETGLIVRAGEWVLREVCRQLIAWRECGLRPVPIAVNLSARQFLAPDLGPGIRAILEEHGIGPELLEVEITESAIMQDAEEARRTLEYLQTLGVHSAVDDFGTGYSSLGYLKRFPLRALKIDRSFVNEITTDEDDAHITQAVISMAHSLELKVIAEGVETEAQLAYLLRYGCDEVQGYLFARPMPADACAAAILDDKRLLAIIEPVRIRAM